MKRKQQLTIAFILNLTITIISGYITLSVLSGKIGNYETWRIVFSVISFLVFFTLLALVVFRIIKENKRLEK